MCWPCYPLRTTNKPVDCTRSLMSFGDEGLMLVTDGVQPNGKAEGVASRYAVSLLTHYSTAKEEKVKIEKIYLSALNKATDTEVKAYFISNLKLVGSNESVKALAAYISDKDLFDPAVSSLVSIGTPDARQALLDALANQPSATQIKLIKALGRFKYQPALESITKFATGDNLLLKKQALWSIALIADAGSFNVLLQQAKNVGFKNDPTEATNALVEYMHQMSGKGNPALLKEISQAILDNTPDPSQQHFRLAGLRSLALADPEGSVKVLIKEHSRFDSEYQKEVLRIAVPSANTSSALKLWQKEYKKATGTSQADILSMMAAANRNESFVETTLVPALSSSNPSTRMAAAGEIATSRNKKYTPALLDYLMKTSDPAELEAAKSAVLQLTDKDSGVLLAQKIGTAQPANKVVLLQILAARRSVENFSAVAKQAHSNDAVVKNAAFEALPYVSSGSHLGELLQMLFVNGNDKELKAIQSAIVSALDKNSGPLINEAYQKEKIKLLPVLPYVDDATALEKVVSTFYHGSDREKEVAFEALEHWQNNDATKTLLAIRKNESLQQYHGKAFQAFVSQVSKSSWPDDQKLLKLREIMPLTSDKKEKAIVIRAAG